MIYHKEKRMPNNKNSFQYNGNTVYYFVKNIDWKEIRGKEMANALMFICDENDNQNDFFSIYDEKYKVMHAMPNDALRWYKEYLSKKE